MRSSFRVFMLVKEMVEIFQIFNHGNIWQAFNSISDFLILQQYLWGPFYQFILHWKGKFIQFERYLWWSPWGRSFALETMAKSFVLTGENITLTWKHKAIRMCLLFKDIRNKITFYNYRDIYNTYFLWS